MKMVMLIKILKFEFNKFFDLIKYKKMNGRTLFVLKKNDKKNTIFR